MNNVDEIIMSLSEIAEQPTEDGMVDGVCQQTIRDALELINYQHEHIEAFLKDYDKQSTISGWISVKDRLPDEHENIYTKDYQEVICCLATRFGSDVRVYKFGNGHFLHDGKEIDKYITHWMPFPELPKEVKYDA